LRVSPDSHLAAAISAQIQLQLVGKLCSSVDTASGDFVRQSHALRESMGGIRSSLRKFRESNERASRALTRATYVLAGVALIQAVILILQWLK
jgi:hypothetical protein